MIIQRNNKTDRNGKQAKKKISLPFPFPPKKKVKVF